MVLTAPLSDERISAWSVTWPLLGLLVVTALLAFQLVDRRRLRREITALEQGRDDHRRRLEQALAAIDDAVFIVDAQQRIVSANPAAKALLGDETRLSGKVVFDLLPLKRGTHPGDLPDPLEHLRRAFEQDRRTTLVEHVSMRRADGQERSAHLTLAPLRDAGDLSSGAVLVVHDTTDRREAEEEKARAERLESIGLLAGGIAHDFNNLLAIILGNLSLLSTSIEDPDDEDARREAEQAAMRAKGLTQQLLTFARGGAPVLRSMHIGPLLRDAASLVFSGRRIIAEIDATDDLPPVAIDAGQIYQVLTNLLINAADAQEGRGTVHLSARPTEIRQRSLMEIRIRDEGPGIDPELQKKIFDAYFSTKPKGTGLGLPTSFSIVHRHGGQLILEETGPEGTTFLIRLPITKDEPQSQREIHTRLIGEGSRVLIMDDDQAIRRVAARMLERRGVQVRSASNGDDAVALWFAAKKRNEPFALGIFDLTVPAEIGGLEAAQQIRERDPEARLIVCSGYANDPIMAEHAEHGFVAVLRKPFQDADLVQTINEAMEADPAPPPRSGEGTL